MVSKDRKFCSGEMIFSMALARGQKGDCASFVGAMTAFVVRKPGPIFAAWLEVDKRKVFFVKYQFDLEIFIC